jgi:hypothetical protein
VRKERASSNLCRGSDAKPLALVLSGIRSTRGGSLERTYVEVNLRRTSWGLVRIFVASMILPWPLKVSVLEYSAYKTANQNQHSGSGLQLTSFIRVP